MSQSVSHIGHDAADQTLYLVQYEDEERRPATRIEISTDSAVYLPGDVDPAAVKDLVRAIRRCLGYEVGLAAA
jgi:hypothetical protein